MVIVLCILICLFHLILTNCLHSDNPNNYNPNNKYNHTTQNKTDINEKPQLLHIFIRKFGPISKDSAVLQGTNYLAKKDFQKDLTNYIPYEDPSDIEIWMIEFTSTLENYYLISSNKIYIYTIRVYKGLISTLIIENISKREIFLDNIVTFYTTSNYSGYYDGKIIFGWECGKFWWDHCNNSNSYQIGFDGERYGGWLGPVDRNEDIINEVKELLALERPKDHFDHIVRVDQRNTNFSFSNLTDYIFYGSLPRYTLYIKLLNGKLCSLLFSDIITITYMEGISLSDDINGVKYMIFKSEKIYRYDQYGNTLICNNTSDDERNINRTIDNIDCNFIYNFVYDGNNIFGALNSIPAIAFTRNDLRSKPSPFRYGFEYSRVEPWCRSDFKSETTIPDDCSLSKYIFIIFIIQFFLS